MIRVCGYRKGSTRRSVSSSAVVWIEEMEKTGNARKTLLQHLNVTIFTFGSAGAFLHELQELSQILPLRRRHVPEANSNPSGRTAAGDDAVQGETLDPDLSVGQPQADFDLCPGPYPGRRFHQAAPGAGIGEIPPDRGGGI